ncbi:bifunctional metallophosphatase/5'-nucleotidase [Nitrospinota bacterium]
MQRRVFLGCALLAALGWALPGAHPLPAAVAAPKERGFTLVHLNDFYRIEGMEGRRKGGISRLGAALKRLRSRGEVLTLLGGDLISPSLMSREFGGTQMIEALNIAGLDLATFGNHEFDAKGPETLWARLAESRFAWVSSNVRQADGKPFPGVANRVLRTVGGVRVGLFGLTIPSRRKPWVRYLDLFAAAKREAAALRREGAEMVIALTHLLLASDRELARRVPGIDLIAGGHEHEATLAREGRTLILKADSDLRTIWVVEVRFPPESSKVPELRPQLIPLGEGAPREPALRALEDRWLARLARRLGPDEKVGESAVILDGLTSIVRFRESNLGNLIADALREEGRCDTAAVNGGAIRIDENITPGPLTRHRVAELFLFRNRVSRLSLQGRTLAAALDLAAGMRGQGGFLHLSGLRVEYAPSAPKGRRARRIEAGGEPLKPDRAYTFCTLDFIARGGDHYRMLAEEGTPLEADAGNPEEMLIRYIRRRGRVAPRREGRIRFVSP